MWDRHHYNAYISQTLNLSKALRLKENGKRPITPHLSRIKTHQAIEVDINLYKIGRIQYKQSNNKIIKIRHPLKMKRERK